MHAFVEALRDVLIGDPTNRYLMPAYYMSLMAMLTLAWLVWQLHFYLRYRKPAGPQPETPQDYRERTDTCWSILGQMTHAAALMIVWIAAACVVLDIRAGMRADTLTDIAYLGTQFGVPTRADLQADIRAYHLVSNLFLAMHVVCILTTIPLAYAYMHLMRRRDDLTTAS